MSCACKNSNLHLTYIDSIAQTYIKTLIVLSIDFTRRKTTTSMHNAITWSIDTDDASPNFFPENRPSHHDPHYPRPSPQSSFSAPSTSWLMKITRCSWRRWIRPYMRDTFYKVQVPCVPLLERDHASLSFGVRLRLRRELDPSSSCPTLSVCFRESAYSNEGRGWVWSLMVA